MHPKIKSYIQLMRFHKPIGIFLLLWPTLWALWIAAGGFPGVKNFMIFVLGVVVMRAAGCVINDIADRKFDRHVTRTQTRPIAVGGISVKQAIFLLTGLCIIALFLVLMTNRFTLLLAVFALLTAGIYPFMKRYTYWPQFILGVAFSFSIPMAFAAQASPFTTTTALLTTANILWTIAYDTEYAMIDRMDDIKIGIKSTAVLLGNYDRFFIGVLQMIVIILLDMIGFLESFSIIYFIAISGALLLFIFQQYLIATQKPQDCLRAFLNNHWVGLIVFVGVVMR